MKKIMGVIVLSLLVLLSTGCSTESKSSEYISEFGGKTTREVITTEKSGEYTITTTEFENENEDGELVAEGTVIRTFTGTGDSEQDVEVEIYVHHPFDFKNAHTHYFFENGVESYREEEVTYYDGEGFDRESTVTQTLTGYTIVEIVYFDDTTTTSTIDFIIDGENHIMTNRLDENSNPIYGTSTYVYSNDGIYAIESSKESTNDGTLTLNNMTASISGNTRVETESIQMFIENVLITEGTIIKTYIDDVLSTISTDMNYISIGQHQVHFLEQDEEGNILYEETSNEFVDPLKPDRSRVYTATETGYTEIETIVYATYDRITTTVYEEATNMTTVTTEDVQH